VVARISRATAHRAYRDRIFARWRRPGLYRLPSGGHTGNPEGIKNEESQAHPEIFVCGPPRKSWPVFWKDYQNFG